MKKNYLSLIITLIVSFFIVIPSTYAEESINIKNISISEQSSTISIEELNYENNNITSSISFNKLNDFVTFDIEIENNTGEDYIFEKINNSINSDYLLIESENLGQSIKSNTTKIIKVKIKYNNELINHNDINLNNTSLQLEFRNSTTFINPKTIENSLIFIFFVALTTFILLKKKKEKYIVSVILLFLIPVFVFAKEKTLVSISFDNITIKGRFLEYRIQIDNGNNEEFINRIYGEQIGELPEIFPKDGYTANGWINQKQETITPETIVTEELTIEPNYEVITYNITYNLNNGSLDKDNKTTYNVEDEFTLNNPTKVGYTFSGWSSDGGETFQTSVTITKGTTGDLNFVAYFSANEDTKYTVIHNKMNLNGVYEEAEREELHGATDTPVTPDRKNYEGFIIPEGETKSINGDGTTTFIYNYERIRYDFSITDRTYIDSTSTVDGNYYYGTTINIKANSRVGYTFRWSDNNTDLERTFELKSNLSLTPIYIPNTNTAYKVIHKTMNLDGSTYSVRDEMNYTGTTDTYIEPDTNIYEGFTAPQTQTVKINGDGSTVVEYLYTRNKYNLVLENSEYIETTTPSGEYYYGTSITLKAKNKNGFTFAKWSNDNTNQEITFNISDHLTIGPIYTENSHIITFNSNGGNDVTDVLIIEPGASIEELPDASRYGYYLDGWYTSLESSGIKVTTSYIPNGDMELFARWKKSIESANVVQTLNVYVGQNKEITFTNKNEIEESYTFTSNDESIATVNNNGVVTGISEGNTTIILTGTTSHKTKEISVIVELSEYVVTFNPNGGEVEESTRTVQRNNPIGTLPDATRVGYYLDGWYTNLTNGEKITNSYIPTSNVEVFAKWKKSIESINTSNTTIDVLVGSTNTIEITNSSEIEEYYTFTSNDNSIATVDENGVITGVSTGQTTITITGSTSHKTKTIIVNVVSPDSIIVTFDPNGGEVETNSKRVNIGSSYGELPTPTKENYEFVGWSYLPSNYTKLDYIMFNANQYIDTGVVPSNHTTEVKFNFDQYNDNEHLFGSSLDYRYYHFTAYNNRYYWGSAGTTDTNGGSWTTGIHTLIYNGPNNNEVILDGTTLGSGVSFYSTTNLWIGKRDTLANLYATIYYFKVTDKSTGEVVRDMIPCFNRSNSTYGLYDLVNNNFYTNNGTGTFGAGSTTSSTVTSSSLLTKNENHTLYANWRYNNPNGGTITYNANGGTYSNDETTNRVSYLSTVKVSHTNNINDDGSKSTNYINGATNSYISGSDRNTGDNTAHVVTIPNAEKLEIDIFYNGESISYDWVSIWSGAHSEYTASNNSSSAITNGQKLGGAQSGTYIVNGHTLNNMGHSKFNIDGDTVTFGFKTDGSGVGQGYGYYAIVKGISYINESYEEPVFNNEVFDGWCTSSSCDNIYNIYSSEPIESTTLYAKWLHHITFNPNGGSVTTSSINIIPGNVIGTLPTPTKTWSTFDGWHTSQTEESRIDSNFIPSETMTIYAHWIPIPYYTITFNSNGGSSISKVEVEQGKSVSSLSSPTKTGYYFDGWYTELNGGTKITTPYTPTDNTTLYAHWKKSVASMNVESVITVIIDSSTLINIPNASEIEEEYTFTSSDTSILTVDQTGLMTGVKYGNAKVTITGKKSGHTKTIYIIVKYEYYEIALDSNGGDINCKIGVKAIDPMNTLPIPKYDNHIFVGWYTDLVGGIKIEDDSYPTNDITLYARWSDIEPYRITFNTNGGSTVNDKLVNPNATIENLPISSKEHYHLDGWYTGLTDGYRIDENYIPTEDTTLYAKWVEAEIYTITFDANDGNVSENSRQVYQDAEIGKLPVPTRDNYYFIGWLDETTDEYYRSTTIPTENKTLVAQWSEQDYVARINKNYYSSINSAIENANENDVIVLLKDATEDISNNKNITIDFNDYIVNGIINNQSNAIIHLLNGILSFNQTVGNIISNEGTIYLGSNDKRINDDFSIIYSGVNTQAIYGINGGKVIINNANINISTLTGGVGAIYGIEADDITMNDGSITMTNNSTYGAYGLDSVNDNLKIVFNDGTISTSSKSYYAWCIYTYSKKSSIIINGGTLNATSTATSRQASGVNISNYASGTLIMNGGTINATNNSYRAYGIINNSGSCYNVIINDGTLNVSGAKQAYSIVNNDRGAIYTINGGNINSKLVGSSGYTTALYNVHSSAYINGGTLTSESVGKKTAAYATYNTITPDNSVTSYGKIYYSNGTLKLYGSNYYLASQTSSNYFIIPSNKKTTYTTDENGFRVYTLIDK